MSTEQQISDLRALVDRYHSENKAAHAELRARMDLLEKADARYEFEFEKIAEKLRAGNTRFAKLTDGIDSVTRPPLWKTLTVGVVVMLALGGWIWTAARYPTKADVKTMIDERAPYLKERERILRVVEGYETNMPNILLQLGVIDVKLDNIIKKLERVD